MASSPVQVVRLSAGWAWHCHICQDTKPRFRTHKQALNDAIAHLSLFHNKDWI